ALLLGVSQIPFVINFFWSLFAGKPAPLNPWNANTLEWTAPSPPPHLNWGRPCRRCIAAPTSTARRSRGTTSCRNPRPPSGRPERGDTDRRATGGLSSGARHPGRDVRAHPPRGTGHEHGGGPRGARLAEHVRPQHGAVSLVADGRRHPLRAQP